MIDEIRYYYMGYNNVLLDVPTLPEIPKHAKVYMKFQIRDNDIVTISSGDGKHVEKFFIHNYTAAVNPKEAAIITAKDAIYKYLFTHDKKLRLAPNDIIDADGEQHAALGKTVFRKQQKSNTKANIETNKIKKVNTTYRSGIDINNIAVLKSGNIGNTNLVGNFIQNVNKQTIDSKKFSSTIIKNINASTNKYK